MQWYRVPSLSFLTLLTFSKKKKRERKRKISALFLAGIPLLCFRYLHSKCGVERKEACASSD